MKNYYITALCIVGMLVFPSIGFTQTGDSVDSTAVEQEEKTEITIRINVPAGLKPNSTFYFFDSLFEKIGLFFVRSTENRIDKLLEYSGEKTTEIEEAQDDPEQIEKSAKQYTDYIDQAILAADNVTTVNEAGQTVIDEERRSELYHQIDQTVEQQLDNVSESVQEYIRAQANNQLEKVKQKAINEISEIEL